MIKLICCLCLYFIAGSIITTTTVVDSMSLSCYAASKNKEPIRQVLSDIIDQKKAALTGTSSSSSGSIDSNIAASQLRVLEIASGTGEHAHYFADSIGGLLYQPTEPEERMMDSIKAWTDTINSDSIVYPPIVFDVTNEDIDGILPLDFKNNQVDVMICINMIHISPIACTDALFRVAHQLLRQDGLLLTYGPYRVDGGMVESNVAFDESLKARNPEWGVRDLEVVRDLADNHGIELAQSIHMPSNNMCLLFRRCLP